MYAGTHEAFRPIAASTARLPGTRSATSATRPSTMITPRSAAQRSRPRVGAKRRRRRTDRRAMGAVASGGRAASASILLWGTRGYSGTPKTDLARPVASGHDLRNQGRNLDAQSQACARADGARRVLRRLRGRTPPRQRGRRRQDGVGALQVGRREGEAHRVVVPIRRPRLRRQARLPVQRDRHAGRASATFAVDLQAQQDKYMVRLAGIRRRLDGSRYHASNAATGGASRLPAVAGPASARSHLPVGAAVGRRVIPIEVRLLPGGKVNYRIRQGATSVAPAIERSMPLYLTAAAPLAHAGDRVLSRRYDVWTAGPLPRDATRPRPPLPLRHPGQARSAGSKHVSARPERHQRR
jgi:hypothetical protein